MVGDKNIEFAMNSHLFYTRTVHNKPSGESKSNVAYSHKAPNECASKMK